MKILCSWFLFLTTLSVFGQQTSGTISGNVKDESGVPLSFANVTIEGLKVGVLTDLNGNYFLEKVPTGKHKVVISFIGYGTRAKTVEITENSLNIRIDFTLQENVENLNEVTVNGKSQKTIIETEGFAVSAVQTEEASIRSIQTNELLNTTVGVKIRQNGGLGSNVEYSLNGLSGSAVRIFIDGIPISVYGSSFSLNSIPPSMIKQIEVYKGVVPGHLADDALGGAINIELHSEAKNNINASISYGSFNTIQANANGVYRFDKSGFTVKASIFNNYSDNNYKVWGRRVVVAGLGGVETPVTARRFNDAYRSTGGIAQIGYTNVKWADQFLVGLTVSDDFKEVQHGAFMTSRPYKDRFLESDATLANITYQKKDLFTEGLDLNIHGLYGKRNRIVNDTVAWAYNWNGERAIDFRGNEFQYTWDSQQEGGPTLATIKRNVASIRSGLNYTINEHHKFLLNHVYSSIDREDSDALVSVLENTFTGDRDLTKNIYALTYEINAFQNKFRASLFGKYYQQETVSIDPEIATGPDGNNIIVDDIVKSTTTNEGYGFAASYAILPNITLLASAEKAIRLPNETEIFGNDGDNVVANPTIKPEQSDNYNLGFRLGAFNFRKHQLTVSTNFFSRNIKDRIGLPIESSLNVDEELILYVNQGSGTSKGIDAQLDYSFNNNLALNFNFSRFELLIENQGVEIDVPNTPFFTMNGGLRYSIQDFLQRKSRLNLFYNIYYTDEFSYLNIRGTNTVGDEFFRIPEQIAQDFGLSYTFPNKKVIMSFDVKNIFDKPVYDNLSVQKPGRAFYLKLNYIINNF
ncbi:MAG: TonB-dependent receptor [Pseudozobellia sp.]|nr:TonB-dependent receptor [Pseudozobellia sp.]MBG50751.1 TonB-dependent receptor [Pseudozobellia sp.]|tara:strand:+ start:6145 stop:8562 length:2418 start_codon:yes stop_codon:yes gene_type:complete